MALPPSESSAGPLFAWGRALSRRLGTPPPPADSPLDAPMCADPTPAPPQPDAPQPTCPTEAPPHSGHTAEQLGAFLSRGLGARVQVVLGRSRRTPIRSETQHIGLVVSHRLVLHRFFSGASQATLDDLLAWMRTGRRARAACSALDAFIAERLEAERPPPARPTAQRLAGDVHHLGELAEVLKSEPSATCLGTLDPWPAITWGRWPNRAPRRSLQLGSYDPERHLVRLHPVLDRVDVPAWFLRSVLHHELVHAYLEGGQRSAPSRVHGPEFRALERAYADHELSEAWLEERLGALLTVVARRVRARQKELRRSP